MSDDEHVSDVEGGEEEAGAEEGEELGEEEVSTTMCEFECIDSYNCFWLTY